MNKEDTKIIAILSVFLAIVIITLVFVMKWSYDNHKEDKYCGNVIEKYITSAGYKVNPQRHVVFYCPKLKRNVDVRVTNQQYVNTKAGQSICFNLNKLQLEE